MDSSEGDEPNISENETIDEEENVEINEEENKEDIDSNNLLPMKSGEELIVLENQENENIQDKKSHNSLLEDNGPNRSESKKKSKSVVIVDENEVDDLNLESKEQDVEEPIMKESAEKIKVIENRGSQEVDDNFRKENEKSMIILEESIGEEETMTDANQNILESHMVSGAVKSETKDGQTSTNNDSVDVLNKTKQEMDETVLTSETFDSLSTSRRSYSATSKTDSDVYDQSHTIRMVNTQAQNTPNQEVATVKFVAGPNVTFAHAFNLSSTIQEIKKEISKLIKVNEKSIEVSKDGYVVDDWLPLAGLGVEAFGCIELCITSTDPTQKIIGVIDENVLTIDVITVHALQDDGSFKEIIVEIHDKAYCKKWLGGFRNRITNIEYHHANTQTLPRERKVCIKLDDPPDTYEYLLFHRDTQTYKYKTIAADTCANKATQMYRSDCTIPTIDDKIITAKEFESYDKWFEKSQFLEKVIKIQRFVRFWLRKKKLSNLISVERQVIKEMHDQKLQMLHEQVEKKRQMISGAAFPSKRDDFYMLYLMVGKWWQKEWERIKDLRTEEPKKAEFCVLLEKEITLLSAIEKHRIEVKKESLRKQEMRFLEMTSRPVIFRNANGGMTSIDDPGTQKAREFKDIYSTLISEELSAKERIDFLLTLKNMMNTYKEYEYMKDIILLIEREINLLVIGIKGSELKGLRKRIEQLFTHFLHQPQFNPKANKYCKPNCPKTVDILYKCTRCFKLLPVSCYPVHTRMTKISVCTSCEWLQNIGHQRIDMSPYLKMLRQIQNSEMEQCCYSAICFVLQQRGTYFLVNTIWHGHSAISECKVLSNLRLVRWIKTIEWSPWNTILLTEEEANCHNSIENVLEFYDPGFIDSVRQKHILARVHFLALLKSDYNLRSTGEWETITDSGPYLHPSHVDQFVQQDNKL